MLRQQFQQRALGGFAEADLAEQLGVADNPDVSHTYAYIGDFGRALVLLGEAEQAFGQAWHVPNRDGLFRLSGSQWSLARRPAL